MKESHILTQIWRVPVPRNSTGTGVAPKSEAMEKYDSAPVVITTMAIWWNNRAPRGLFNNKHSPWMSASA